VFETTPKMLAENHFPEIIGINLEYALDTYDWEGWNPITDMGLLLAVFGIRGKEFTTLNYIKSTNVAFMYAVKIKKIKDEIRRLPQYHLLELWGGRRFSQINTDKYP